METHRLVHICLCLQLLIVTRTLIALPVEGASKNDLTLSSAPGFIRVERDAMRQQHRSRRTADGNESPAMEYVMQLKNSLTDDDGNPFVSEEDPTSVWCLLDKDVLQETYREKASTSQKCTTKTQFIFSWQSLADAKQSRHLTLQKGILHTYLQVIPRLLLSSGTTEVDISITMNPHGDNSSSQSVILAGQTQLSVSTDSAGWLELNITDGVHELWEQNSDYDEIQLTIELRVNCIGQKKVPVYLTDPASISLSQSKRRQRYEKLQPLFLVYLNDAEVKEVVRHEVNDLANSTTTSEIGPFQEQSSHAEKRSTNGVCSIEDFRINFQVLQLNYILVPHTYNAYRCTGSCSHSTLSRVENLGTNHAKIIASTKAISQQNPSILFTHPPKDPCCAPTKYGPLAIIIKAQDGSLNIELYPSMIVRECGCR